jgi:hypothetical protein
MIVYAKPFDQKTRFNLDDYELDQIYLGKQDCCRCGCGGDYADQDNPELLNKRFNRFKRMAEVGALISYIDSKQLILEITTGQDRCLTVYLNPKK